MFFKQIFQCCNLLAYLTPKQMVVYNEVIWNSLHLQIVSGNYLSFLEAILRHVLTKTTTERCF